jgi:ABC-type amino acid transport substrate-binding protein
MHHFIGLLFLSLLFSCGSTQPTEPALRVGISPDYEPVIFKKNNQITGLEAAFAKHLGKELNREIQFVEMPFTSLIPALQGRRIDIIMSGMSITEERQQKVKFTQPYMSISQMLLIRREEMGRFQKPGNNRYINSSIIFGAERGTTGHQLAVKHLPKNRIVPFSNFNQGLTQLKAKKIDCYIADAPMIWNYADGRKDPALTGVYWDFSKEQLAWAINKTNFALYRQVSSIAQKWHMQGTASNIISHWVPMRINYK